MATNNYAAHTDSLGRSPGARLPAFGYPYAPWGENIAGGFPDAQNAFNQWLTACDPDASGSCTYAHRKNVFNAAFQVIGIGRAYSSSSAYGWYWTTDFGGFVDQTISPAPTPAPAPAPVPAPVPVPAPTIMSFQATPSAITAGQGATLSWTVNGASSVNIDNGIGDVTNLTSKPVTPAQTTTYTLAATNSSGSATARVTVSVSPVQDTLAPTAPTLTSATARSSSEVDLAWTASTDNVGVAGYQIIRNGSVLTSVAGTVLAFVDTGASPSSTYTYAIKAYDAAGNSSSASNSVQVTTPAAPVSGGACGAAATGAFTGCYYNNLSLSGSPVLVRTDSQINFDWGTGSPDPSVTAAGFSVRWQGSFNFTQGTHTFTAMTSDGMRVYIDGNLVLDRWRDQPAYIYTFQPTLSEGSHLITVEYYEHTGWPTAHLTWQ